MTEEAAPAAAPAANAGATTTPPDAAAAGGAAAVQGVVAPPQLVEAPTGPPPRRVLVVGDDNLLFTSGLQEAYPDIEFTVVTMLSRQLLEAYNFDPLPQVLKGRIRHMVDPCRMGRSFPQQYFDDILLFLPGLGFMVPREMGSADRPLFAYRTHLFAFHVIRHSKLVLKGGEDGKQAGRLHLVWPEDNKFLTSPCGAAGIEMQQLINFCGCKPCEASFEMDKIQSDHFWPFVFGEVPAELPEWLTGSRILSFTLDRSPIPIPLSVALLLHPDVGFVTLKDATAEGGPPAGSSLRAYLIHEAMVRRDRLKEMYGPKEVKEDRPDALGLVPEPPEEDSLLSIPMEIFMTSFDDLPHLSVVLKYLVVEEQPSVSVASLDVLDPRLPTRIARPPQPKKDPAAAAAVAAGAKRARPAKEHYGGMKFLCTLTKICTPTAERMRAHMQGDLYKRLSAATPSWVGSPEMKDLILDLEEEETEERAKRARLGSTGGAQGNAKSEGKGGKSRGGKGRGKRDAR